MKLHGVLLLQLIAFAVGQPETCTREGAVKLAAFNSNDLYAGIVEVCHNGYWGTICTDSLTRSWSEKNAHLACWNAVNSFSQNLSYSGALNSIILSTIPDSYKVPESVPIHYRSVVCDGTERTFADCYQISTNTSQCTHDYDAAVVCRQNSKTDDVRLVGSGTDGQGAVEMNVAGYGWVRLCPEAFDLSGVCNKLGYTSTAYQNFKISRNRDSLTRLSLTTVCETYYKYYYYYYYDSYYDEYYYESDIDSYESCTTEYTTYCDYTSGEYAGVTCSNSAVHGSVRLYGGSDEAIGNVEVFYNGVWGAVCSTGWNANAGRLVCTQLGYDPNNEYFAFGSGGLYSGQNYLKPIWLNNVSNCSHLTNKKITECSYTPPIGYGQGCSSANVATLQCDFVLTDGAIAGIVIGSIIFVLAIVAIIIGVCCCIYSGICKKMKCCCQWTYPGNQNTTEGPSENKSAGTFNSGSNYPSQYADTSFQEPAVNEFDYAHSGYLQQTALPQDVPVASPPTYEERLHEY